MRLTMRVLLLAAGAICAAANGPSGSVPLIVYNDADSAIALFWENPTSHELSNMGPPIQPQHSFGLDSYANHRFVVQFAEHEEGTEVRFVKGSMTEDCKISFDAEEGQLQAVMHTQLKEISTKPRRKQKKEEVWEPHPKTVNSSLSEVDTVRQSTVVCQALRGAAFSSCMASNIIDDITKLSSTKAQLSKYRDLMSSRLRNYTCADNAMPSTPPLHSYNVSLHDMDVQVDVMLHKNSSKIWIVENFVTDEECDILMKHGLPLLRRATVADDDGSSKVSDSRKAQQAGYNLHVQNPQADPLRPLYLRTLEVTNKHASFALQPEGQEDFTIIQYNPSDQYTPHCDGACDNSQHIDTGRVATAVLYCKVAEEGGATTFTKADIFVKPKSGSATFFAYRGPDGRMDDGYTEHSGCPVTQGEKWITTVWMRDGVSRDKPWSMFDPNGVKMMDS